MHAQSPLGPSLPEIVVYTRMVGDLFHRGHVAYLAGARALGHKLVVHVFSDEHTESIKHRPIMTQAERIEVIAACRHVDEVRAHGPTRITRAFMAENGFSIYAFGCNNADEAARKRANCSDLDAHMVVEIPYTLGISTTLIRQRILNARSA